MAETKEKGDVGLVKVIADLTMKGATIFLPLSEHMPFDLIAYKDGKCYRIQAKYTMNGVVRNKRAWVSCKKNHSRNYASDDFDYYGLYLPEVDRVIYPSIKFGGCTIRCIVPNAATPFYWYEDFIDFTDQADKKTFRDFGKVIHVPPSTAYRYVPRPATRKVERPSKDILEKLMWEKPVTQIASDFGVSDKAVGKWAKTYGLIKPPRGYWTSRCVG